MKHNPSNARSSFIQLLMCILLLGCFTTTVFAAETKYYWKKKDGSYAMFKKVKGEKAIQLTDYIYWTGSKLDREVRWNSWWWHGGNDRYNYVFVNKNGKYGVLDNRGKEIIPCEYNQIKTHGIGTPLYYQSIYNSPGSYTNTLKKDNEHCIGSHWQISSKSYYYRKYDIATAFEVRKDNKVGIVKIKADKNKGLYATEIIPCIYEKIDSYLSHKKPYTSEYWDYEVDLKRLSLSHNMRVKGTDAGYKCVINTKELIFQGDENIFCSYITHSKDGVGMIFLSDKIGEVERVIPAVYDEISSKKYHVSFNKNRYNTDVFEFKKKGRICLVSKEQGEFFEANDEFASEPLFYWDDRTLYYSYTCKNNTGGTIQLQTGRHIPYHNVQSFTPVPGDSISVFIGSAVGKDGLFGIYNAVTQRELLPPIYTSIQKTNDQSGFFVFTDTTGCSQLAFLNSKQDRIEIVNTYEDLFRVCEVVEQQGDFLKLRYEDGYGLYNANGLLIPCTYDSIKPLKQNSPQAPASCDDLYLVWKNKRFGVADSKRLIAPPLFNRYHVGDSNVTFYLHSFQDMYYTYNRTLEKDLEFTISHTDDGRMETINIDQVFMDFVTNKRDWELLFELGAYLGDDQVCALAHVCRAFRESLDNPKGYAQAQEAIMLAHDKYGLHIDYTNSFLTILQLQKENIEEQKRIAQAKQQEQQRLAQEQQRRAQQQVQQEKQRKLEMAIAILNGIAQVGNTIVDGINNVQAAYTPTYAPSNPSSTSPRNISHIFASSQTPTKTSLTEVKTKDYRKRKVSYDVYCSYARRALQYKTKATGFGAEPLKKYEVEDLHVCQTKMRELRLECEAEGMGWSKWEIEDWKYTP